MNAFFGTKWQFSGKIRQVHNPYTEEVIGEVPDLGPEVLDETFRCLESGCADLANLGKEDHHAIFDRFVQILRSQRNELIQLIQIEQGKPFHEASQEYENALNSVEILADNGSLIGQEISPLAREPSSRGWTGFTLRQPHGIVGILTPVTYPLLFPVIHTCYALAAGNAVVLKPARVTPMIALVIVRMLLQAGVPPSAIACIPGSGKTLGKELCAHPLVDHLSCMGTIATMKSIRKVAAFVPAQLQWGCVSSVVADKGADLDRLVSQVISTSFENAGQSAFTPTWIAAVDEIHDQLVDQLAAQIEKIKPGNPLDPSTRIGPVSSALSKRRFDEVMAHEITSGATVAIGGTREGRKVSPTLLINCDPEKSNLARQEVRAPLIGVTRIKNKEEAITPLQKQRYHILTLFTDEAGEAVEKAMNLSFENFHINGIPTWRDGLICVPGHPPRSGVRDSYSRIHDYSRSRDIVAHDATRH